MGSIIACSLEELLELMRFMTSAFRSSMLSLDESCSLKINSFLNSDFLGKSGFGDRSLLEELFKMAFVKSCSSSLFSMRALACWV